MHLAHPVWKLTAMERGWVSLSLEDIWILSISFCMITVWDEVEMLLKQSWQSKWRIHFEEAELYFKITGDFFGVASVKVWKWKGNASRSLPPPFQNWFLELELLLPMQALDLKVSLAWRTRDLESSLLHSLHSFQKGVPWRGDVERPRMLLRSPLSVTITLSTLLQACVCPALHSSSTWAEKKMCSLELGIFPFKSSCVVWILYWIKMLFSYELSFRYGSFSYILTVVGTGTPTLHPFPGPQCIINNPRSNAWKQ